MKKMIGYLLILVVVVAIAGYYYVFIYAKNHHRDVQSEAAITIQADSLSAAFGADEKTANAKFLNKAVEVTGTVLSVDKNQAGQTMIMLGNATAFSNVSVTMATGEIIDTKKIGTNITIKGICTGALSDVVITEGRLLH